MHLPLLLAEFQWRTAGDALVVSQLKAEAAVAHGAMAVTVVMMPQQKWV